MNHPLHRGAVCRGRSQIDQCIEHFLYAKVVDRRAEEHRRLLACQKQVAVKLGRGTGHQFYLVLRLLVFGAKALGCCCIV